MNTLSRIALAAFALAISQAARANLVSNPGFEDGFSGPTPTDWNFTFAASGADAKIDDTAHSGSFAYWFGATSIYNDTIDQSIATTAGDEYQISYWLQTSGGDVSHPTTGEGFDAGFGGVFQDQVPPIALAPYTEYTFDAVATGSSTDLSFAGRSTSGWYQLDDVDVEDLGPAARGVPDQNVGFAGLAAIVGMGLLSSKKSRRTRQAA